MTARAGANDDQYMVRLPPGLREQIRERADTNGRSMNTEIVAAIQRHLERANLLDELAGRVDALEKRVSQPVGGPKR